MTEQETQIPKFTDHAKPVQKEELSLEDQEKYFGSQLSNEDLDLINGPIESPKEVEEPKEKEKLEELGKTSDKLSDTAIKAVSDITDMFVSMSCIDIANFH